MTTYCPNFVKHKQMSKLIWNLVSAPLPRLLFLLQKGQQFPRNPQLVVRTPDFHYLRQLNLLSLAMNPDIVEGQSFSRRSIIPWITRKKEQVKIWLLTFKPNFHEILPIDLDVHRGAIVLGNFSTPSLLVATFLDANGSYNVVPVIILTTPSPISY